MKLFKIAMGVIFTVYVLSSPAMAEEKLSSIWLYYSEDEFNSKDTSALFNFAISENDTINMSLGESTSEYNVVLNNTPRVIELTTAQFSLGYNTIKYAPWALNMAYEYWGRNNEIEFNTLLFDADYFFNEWVAGIRLQYRQMDFYNKNPLASNPHIEVDSYGIGLITEKDWHDVRWSVYADWYDYDEEIQNFTTLQLIRLIGVKNYTQAGVLVDWSAGTSLRYQFDDLSAALKYSHSVSAVSSADSDTYALVLDATLTDLMLNFEWGRSYLNSAVQDSETDYVVIGLGVKF